MAVIKTVQEESLVALGDAIREKAGTNEPLVFPTGMINAINNIETGGGGVDIEPIVLTGACDYACAGTLGSLYVQKFGNTISTKDITDTDYMFAYYTGSIIPFEINCSANMTGSLSRMFNASKLTTVPRINNAKPSGLGYMFYNCYRLRTIPEDFGDNWNWDALNTNNYGIMNYIFNYCYSLRNISTNFLKNLWGKGTSSTYVPYTSTWNYCTSLDELIGVPIQQAQLTSNRFSSTFNSCSRLKNLIFATQEDGTPYTVQWKSQTIALHEYVGYGLDSYITNYNSGITKDSEVYNDETYQALKNSPDWYSTMLAYSRYNHDGAVETINSLPDTSAYLAEKGGTNTIKFKGDSGSKTDGGAINTLTEEEIAVATAKGWTVSFA